MGGDGCRLNDGWLGKGTIMMGYTHRNIPGIGLLGCQRKTMKRTGGLVMSDKSRVMIFRF
jgi:hypothetical protein